MSDHWSILGTQGPSGPPTQPPGSGRHLRLTPPQYPAGLFVERVPQSFSGRYSGSQLPCHPAFLLAGGGYNTPMNAVSPDPTHPKPSVGRSLAALTGWLLLTFSASATAVFVSTGGWYAALAKPIWNPPGWLFGPVWTVLYAMMAVAAWRVWLQGGWSRQKAASTPPVHPPVGPQRPVDAPVLRPTPAGLGAGGDPGPAGGHPGDHTRILEGGPARRLPIALLRRLGVLRHRAQLDDLAAELRSWALRTGTQTAPQPSRPSPRLLTWPFCSFARTRRLFIAP